ncbi:hypothetical protein M0813_04483 [Anaeramoeba flamelloides]|uniref:Uncharacterized protein n=1 Tax=Anaeramoeba flamelloides TaxID=1746091 RepID=A0ABQ8XJ71_9EUKA|nr:hypothetical protein M0813_04483 [Anaeramoeba flamelloides]
MSEKVTGLSKVQEIMGNGNISDSHIPMIKVMDPLSLPSSEWENVYPIELPPLGNAKEEQEQEQEQDLELDLQNQIPPAKSIGRKFTKSYSISGIVPTWERYLSDSNTYCKDLKRNRLRLSELGLDLDKELDMYSELKNEEFDPSTLSENEPNLDQIPPDPKKKCDTYQLHTIYTAPLVLGYFRYIEQGYRVFFTKKLCLQTAFTKIVKFFF